MQRASSLTALAAIIAAILLSAEIPALEADERPELPRPTFENTFYLFFRCRSTPKAFRNDGNDDDQRRYYDDFMMRMGPQRLYSRVSLRGGPYGDTDIRHEYGFVDHMGGNGFHRFWSHWKEYKEIVEHDRRYLQWFNNGAVKTERKTHFGPTCCTVSRYATDLWTVARARYRHVAERFLMQDPPADKTNCMGRIALLGPIESSLLETGSKDGLFCDYSPIAITEFRDWLTHRGKFGKGGEFEGQGRPGGHIFADDPSPAESTTGEKTFNEAYGTEFTTWSLKYWDLKEFTDPLAEDADGMPGPGAKGHFAGGFDAPRDKDDEGLLWQAWHNDDGATPGFRQLLIANYVGEFQKAMNETGVPRERIFSAIIAHSDHKWHQQRQFVDADPPWVAKSEYGSPGFTAYGTTAYDEKVLAQLQEVASDLPNKNWAMVEWHPVPHPPDSFLAPVDKFREAIDNIWKYRPHLLEIEAWEGLTFGGKWGYETHSTNFETALRQWRESVPDRPYYETENIDYAPPPVRGMQKDKTADSKGRFHITWYEKIWPGLPYKWTDWQDFSHFAVYGTDENERRSLLTEVKGTSVRFPDFFDGFAEYEVVAVKKGEKPAPGYRLTKKDVMGK